MCAIFGFVSPQNTALLLQMSQTLKHRGPDDTGLWESSACSLGLDRLSIVDVEKGSQPCVRESVVSVMNGEIYNFRELRLELERLGFVFHSDHSDAELIPAAYLAWGDRFVNHLDGMFAIALWDAKEQKLFLMRDDMGKKPCYYTVFRDKIYFASEIKALLHVTMSHSISEAALCSFLAKKSVSSPLSIFENIYSVQPATVLTFQAGTLLEEKRYWQPRFDGTLGLEHESEYIEYLTQTLQAAVRKRCDMDVEFGAFLSGGLDSSLVATLTAQYAHKQLETFTLVYEDSISGKNEDERFAHLVAEQIGAKRHIYRLGHEEVWNSMPRVLRSFDEPFSATISPYFLCSLVAQYVKVALCGDGADELFGSYLTHRNSAKLDELGHTNIANSVWRKDLNVFSDAELSMLLNKHVNTPDLFAGGTHARTQLHQTLEGEFCDQLSNQVLKYADRLSMAHGVEVRSPFLDRTFVELAGHIPSNFKIYHGEVKYLLKKAALQFLPQELVYRPKEGFVLPIWRWMDDVWRERIKETLRSSDIYSDFGINLEIIEKLIKEWDLGAKHHAKLWSLTILALWNRERKQWS